MSLAALSAGRIAFDKPAIMRRAAEHARFALQLWRARREPASERNRILSRTLTKAWAEAKRDARDLARRIESDTIWQRDLAARAAEAVALAGRYGNDADAIRQAIASESYRERMNFAAVDRLNAALATVRS